MSKATEIDVIKVLGNLVEPKLKWNIISLNLLKNIVIENNNLSLDIHLVTTDKEQIETFKNDCLELLNELGFDKVNLNLMSVHIGIKGISGVDNVILVASGKGGVGKSTVATNLAIALSKHGLRVGIMDADVYGPSIPTMLGIKERPEVLGEEYLLPVKAFELQVMSIGMLVPENKAVSWRAQLVTGTIIQFIQNTFWNKLDYLVIDLPPGTGDIYLTIAQKIRIQGVVMVSTPQEVVLGDVRRSLDLCIQKNIPVLALVENMSGMYCEKCGHENHPFTASKIGYNINLEHYFQIPLDGNLSKSGDSGIPLVIQYPEHQITKKFNNLSEAVINQIDSNGLSGDNKSYK